MKGPYNSALLLFAARIQAPLLQLYALYVLFHGHYSPGGGFQAGAALAGSFLVPRLVEGLPDGVHGLTTRRATAIALLGIALYGAVGVVSMLDPGTAFLDYAGLGGLPGWPLPPGGGTRAIGSLVIEVGITLTVMGVLVMLFDDLVARSET
jgi:multicomponent Na+:H+ antiporter subunit B